MAVKYKKAHPSLHPHRGWHPDHLDPRDMFAAPPSRTLVKSLPPVVSLRNTPNYPVPYDQLQEGSCTGNSSSFLPHYIETVLLKSVRKVPARNFQYYNTRVLQGTPEQDSGGTNRNALKAMAKWGYCADDLWPYDQATMFTKPAAAAYTEAAKHVLKSIMYLRLQQDATHLKACLAQGLPFIFGFNVYQSFMNTGKNGMVPMPNYSAEKMVGGHSVAVVGYDDAKACFEVRNSWGPKWAAGGHCYMPYQYVLNTQLANDFWMVQSIPTADEES